MELQVEGIYTAEPRFEAKAKALKLKQEMAAAAEEERKRLRGMPGQGCLRRNQERKFCQIFRI